MTTMANTYSIVAHDPDTGQIGVAVQTHQMGVGRVVPWLKPGVGAIATQSLVNISYGPDGLRMLGEGRSPVQVIDALTSIDPRRHNRQLAVLAADGQVSAFSGEQCIAHAGHHVGAGYSVQANMMTRPTVIDAMREGYEGASGELVERMMAAMHAAQAEDGDIRGMQSAALVIVPAGGDDIPGWASVYDLRVDEHAEPLTELARLVRLRQAQHLSNAGDAAFNAGKREDALRLWLAARQKAPELEELAFWQAVTLADEGEDVAGGAAVFNEVFANDPRREHWIDLIGRLAAVKLIEREGAAAELVAAVRG